MTTATAVYVRQSIDKRGDAAGVDRQESACRSLAAAKGLEDLTLYADNDRSATTGKRPEFERLIKDIEAGRVGTLVVFHLDRLTRSIADLTRVIESGRLHQLNIASVHGVGIDLGDPTGVAVATILTAVAAMEVQHKGVRQRAANRQRAERGQAFWTRRPFGYDRTGGVVFTVDAEAEAIRDGARMLLAGSTLAAVARSWNDAGLRTTAVKKSTGEGGLWGVTQVRRLMLNPRYAGRQLYNGQDMGAGDWPIILDAETMDALEVKLTDPRRKNAPDDLNAKYLLSGQLVCGKCGAAMFAAPSKYKGRTRMTYRCFGGYCMGRGLEDVDAVAEAALLGRLSMPDAHAALTAEGDVKALNQRAADLRDRRDALAALLADGLMSPTAVREQAGKLARELEHTEHQIAAASGTDPVTELAQATDVPARWAATPMSDRRKIIRSLMTITVLSAGKGVRFSPEQIQIDWKAGA